MHSLSRRDVLSGVLLTAVAPSKALAVPDPHTAWLEEWRALHDLYESLPDDPDGLHAELWRIVELTDETPATTAQGLIAKLELFRDSHFGFDGCYVDPETANRMIDQTIAFLGGQP